MRSVRCLKIIFLKPSDKKVEVGITKRKTEGTCSREIQAICVCVVCVQTRMKAGDQTFEVHAEILKKAKVG